MCVRNCILLSGIIFHVSGVSVKQNKRQIFFLPKTVHNNRTKKDIRVCSLHTYICILLGILYMCINYKCLAWWWLDGFHSWNVDATTSNSNSSTIIIGICNIYIYICNVPATRVEKPSKTTHRGGKPILTLLSCNILCSGGEKYV